MWLVLCVRSDEEWHRLCTRIGRSDLAKDKRFLTAGDRRIHHDALDEAISAWSSGYDHHEGARILQEAGIPAAPVLANWELVSNIHLHERGFYVPVAHREMGVFPYPGMPWKFSATPGTVRMASPCFGEHNGLLFEGLLKLSSNELEELYRDKVIADDPPEDLEGPIRLETK